jgi:hypothetical protein
MSAFLLLLPFCFAGWWIKRWCFRVTYGKPRQ